jgi:hypothetical protein
MKNAVSPALSATLDANEEYQLMSDHPTNSGSSTSTSSRNINNHRNNNNQPRQAPSSSSSSPREKIHYQLRRVQDSVTNSWYTIQDTTQRFWSEHTTPSTSTSTTTSTAVRQVPPALQKVVGKIQTSLQKVVVTTKQTVVGVVMGTPSQDDEEEDPTTILPPTHRHNESSLQDFVPLSEDNNAVKEQLSTTTIITKAE